ncbi:MAG: LLM class flavin-dependent oxidoreductase [Dehalococcoidia bacterium]
MTGQTQNSEPGTSRREVTAGIFLTNQHPVGSDLVRALDEQIMMLHAARDAGWNTVWVGQHFLPAGMTMMQPTPYLARLATEAGEMRLGLGILLLALLNPLQVAEEVATLDIISRGRVIFGVGLGYRDVEYEAFGLTRAEGVRRLRENLRVVRALWTQEHVEIDLPWCQISGAGLTTRPVQKPHPPIWIAANSDSAVRRAARLSDVWLVNPHASVPTIRRQIDIFRETRAAAGLPEPAELPAIREVFCGRTREEALAMARPYLDAKYQVYAAWGQDKVMPAEETFHRPFDDLANERFVIGTPDDCLRALLPWRDELGVNHFIFRTHWSGMPVEYALSSMDLISREVIPALQRP